MIHYVHETRARWKQFQRSHPEIACQLKTLILGSCTDMTAAERKKQVEAMLVSEGFGQLREIALRYDTALGIREHTDKELALWIRTLCFCHTMDTERAA